MPPLDLARLRARTKQARCAIHYWEPCPADNAETRRWYDLAVTLYERNPEWRTNPGPFDAYLARKTRGCRPATSRELKERGDVEPTYPDLDDLVAEMDRRDAAKQGARHE